MIRFEQAGVDVDVLVDGRPSTRTLLHPFSLDLTEARIGVIGANGSGKSTLLRLVNGLTVPTRGRVLVDGCDPHRDGARVRRGVGFTTRRGTRGERTCAASPNFSSCAVGRAVGSGEMGENDGPHDTGPPSSSLAQRSRSDAVSHSGAFSGPCIAALR